MLEDEPTGPKAEGGAESDVSSMHTADRNVGVGGNQRGPLGETSNKPNNPLTLAQEAVHQVLGEVVARMCEEAQERADNPPRTLKHPT